MNDGMEIFFPHLLFCCLQSNKKKIEKNNNLKRKTGEKKRMEHKIRKIITSLDTYRFGDVIID